MNTSLKLLNDNSDSSRLVITRHNLEFVGNFIQKIPAGIAIFDHEMRYLAVSDRWFKESKLPKHNLVGKCHYDVIEDIPLKWRRIHQRALNGEHLKSDGDVYNRQDGTTEWLKWDCFPWYSETGSVGGIIIFFEHTTERKLIKQEMERTIQTLNNSNVELGRFAHMCAHDLSEPLRTISNYIQLIEQTGMENVQPEIKDYLNSVLVNAKYMHTLVSDILRYAELNTQKIKKKDVPLHEIITTIKTIFEKAFRDKSVQFTCDRLPVVKADEVLITRVFQNLISNALKFNANQPPIINIKVKDIKNAWLIAVEDNGIGIHANYHEKIFDLFERLHTKSKYGGSGIGLSLCKKIVEAHSGKIWVYSALNIGSTFYFTLPKK
jgi:PAS domain S-box-containing protein